MPPDGGWKGKFGAWLWKTFNGGGEIVGEKGNWSVAQQGADGWNVYITNDLNGNNNSAGEILWNSQGRRNITGDMFQISTGWDASLFAGGGTTLEFNWLLTGKDASFFPYIGYSAHGTVSDGGNLSADLGFNKAYHSGPVDAVNAGSLPGWEFGVSVGGKIIAGADIGYSYSPDGEYGWHQINTSVGVGLELSPFTAANVQANAEYNFVQFHTGTGKWYTND